MSEFLDKIKEKIESKSAESNNWENQDYAWAYRDGMGYVLGLLEEAEREAGVCSPVAVGSNISEPEKETENEPGKDNGIEIGKENEIASEKESEKESGPQNFTEGSFFDDDPFMEKTPHAVEERYIEPKVKDPAQAVPISSCPDCGRYIPYGTPYCPHCKRILDWRL